MRTQAVRANQHRADPLDTRTWREVEDLQPALRMRLKLGGWVGVHVRVQGVRALFGSNPMGVLETVPPAESYGWPDWLCFHPRWLPGVVIELKSEAGVVDYNQRRWLARFARAGYEVAVIRPRHVVLPRGQDLLYQRLVLHRTCPSLCAGSGPACIGWCKVRWRVTP